VNAGTTIRKILFVTIWLLIGGGMFTLLLAAISSKNRNTCSDIRVEWKSRGKNFFIDEKDVEQILAKAIPGNIKGRLVNSINLHELESLFEKNQWINDAELFFDNRDVLHISIRQQEPVARIFTSTGNSFYIDSSGKKMPLSDKMSAKVPVFTGFPDKKVLTARDSVLLNGVRTIANYIIRYPFWTAQVAQVDISEDRKFEMIPMVGNHIVKLGDANEIPAKFRRLMIFYQQVLRQTGFDRYKLIDVQYRGQVVATRYAGDPKIDSVQLRKNVEKLLKHSLEAANDTVARKLLPPAIQLEKDSTIKPDLPTEEKITSNPEKRDPNPRLSIPSIRQPADGGQAVSAKTDKADEKRKPKAVMPKRGR
jgi:cell division protein FtsQ